MRLFTLTALLMFSALPAFAQDIDVDTGDTKKPAVAQPHVPSATPATDISKEPNLKPKDGSGGTPSSYLIKDAPLPGDHTMGAKTAPILIIEYASMSCPHCAHFSNTILPELQKRYIDTGSVRYILRQFPLNEPALKGAMLLDCVGEQDNDRYFIFAKVLFDAQNKWAFDGNFMSGLETIAGVGGVSKEQFQSCMSSTDRETKVLKAKKLATDELKIPHTPYFYIGGEAYEGDKSVEEMSKFIDAKLAEKQKK